MEYYSLNRYLRDTFGEKVYKVALDGGFTCPNRDGSLDSRGCIFCNGGSSSDYTERNGIGSKKQRYYVNPSSGRRVPSISQQLENGMALVSRKMPQGQEGKFIAYFQAYTSTYCSAEVLRQVVEPALRHPQVVALSIATRPDCLSPEIYEFLGQCNDRKPTWVELGLQTIHPETAAYIRRGYDLEVYDRAVERLAAMGLPQIVTHLILGLPGEDRDMILDSVRYVAASKSNGIKLQLLHVMEGTDLAADYRAGKFDTLTLEDYGSLIRDCVGLLPADMVVHRLTGDGDKRSLIAPSWSGDKKRVLNAVNKALAD